MINLTDETKRLCEKLTNRSVWQAPITPRLLDDTVAHMRALQAELDAFRAVSISLQARVAELESVCREVEMWNLDWVDGLDSNVERIKTRVAEVLRD